MIILTGYSGSGKDTILKELVKLGFNPIISYTTRPIRPGEQDGVEYHFITNEEFVQKKKEGFFAETTQYTMVGRNVYYGSAIEDYVNTPDGVVILNLDGLKQITNKGLEFTSYYLNVPLNVLTERLMKRGDNIKEIQRRLDRDTIDFSSIHNKVDFIIDANNKEPYQIVSDILSKHKGECDERI